MERSADARVGRRPAVCASLAVRSPVAVPARVVPKTGSQARFRCSAGACRRLNSVRQNSAVSRSSVRQIMRSTTASGDWPRPGDPVPMRARFPSGDS
jgi:hypothetical protein